MRHDMASKGNLVNLDAMIKRADFASTAESETTSFDTINSISVRHLDDFTGILRKPDFQRETNHWSPQQVVSLLESFVTGDLIPSVILWKSNSYLFVIDGGHRISALRAWVEDDYGDRYISSKYFDGEIPKEQKKIAEKTRALVNAKVGSWADFNRQKNDENLQPQERARIQTILTRALPIQWVTGDADKAEVSFFNINMKGTALDDVEELLLKSRKKPTSIAARAVIRAGKGHKYWSSFSTDNSAAIEKAAAELHSILFDPDLKRPIKTLDLPLGGSRGVRVALQLLIDFILAANKNQDGIPEHISDQDDDPDGSLTVTALKNSSILANRITGNNDGSLGLHPAIYFYGPTGRHSGPMFMGTVNLIAKKLINHDKNFFVKFSRIRRKLEQTLINEKDLISKIIHAHVSGKRTAIYCELLELIIDSLNNEEEITEIFLIEKSNLRGKIVAASPNNQHKKFNDDSKSQAFISSALQSAMTCAICGGYLDPVKSVSYDHIIRVQDGGLGNVDNCQLTHPYCNMSMKN